MKTTTILFAVAFLMLLLGACGDDDEFALNNKQSFLTIEGSRNGLVKDKNDNFLWAKNSIIGLFLTTEDNSIIDEFENIRYISENQDGKFLPANKYTDILYFPENIQSARIISYYPHTSDMANGVYKVDVSSQSEQQKIDLLYSNTIVEKSKDNVVKLDFDHELAKVVFNIQAEFPIISLKELKISITNLHTKGEYFITDRSLVKDETSLASIDMKTTINELTAVSEGIIIPETAAHRKFIFRYKLGNNIKTFEWDASSQIFARAKKNIYNVRIAGESGKVTISSTIEDWGLGSSETIIIGPNENAEKGTKNNPYTVAESINKTGEKGKWITGYIVGATNTPRLIGTPSQTNILLADNAGETEKSKCIIIDLENSPVQFNLNIVNHPELIGKKIKIQGNVVDNLYAGASAMTSIMNQEGGAELEYVTKEFFSETFGTPATPGSGAYTATQLDKHTNFDMTSPVTYKSGATSKMDLRYVTALPEDGFTVWFPTHTGTTDKDRSLVIEGIASNGYTDLELSYDYLVGVATTTYNTLTLKCNGAEMSLPTTAVGIKEAFQTVKVTIPEGTTTIEFAHTKQSGTDKHIRLDNIKIAGKIAQ